MGSRLGPRACPDCTVPGLSKNHGGPHAHRMWHTNGSPCDDVKCDVETHFTDETRRQIA